MKNWLCPYCQDIFPSDIQKIKNHNKKCKIPKDKEK